MSLVYKGGVQRVPVMYFRSTWSRFSTSARPSRLRPHTPTSVFASVPINLYAPTRSTPLALKPRTQG
eukprot:1188886-Prorocentrum_minimum.AAC.2